MLLSDKLEEVYNNSGKFDLETCNAIIHVIADKIKEEIEGFMKTAKQKGNVNSNILYSSVNSIRNVFNNFIKNILIFLKFLLIKKTIILQIIKNL